MIKKIICFLTVICLLSFNTSIYAISLQENNEEDTYTESVEDKEDIDTVEINNNKLTVEIIQDDIIEEEITEQPIVTPYFASGGENHSHQYLIDRAIKILENDSKTDAAYWLNKYKSDLKLGADWPDISQRDVVLFVPTFKGHFYHAKTQVNYLDESNPTAMTRFIEHMNAAVESFDINATDNKESMFLLGIAMHYFSDMNAPHHAANKIAGLSNHSQWEEYADVNRLSYVTNYGTMYDKYGLNFKSYAQDSANHAYGYINDATSSDKNKWDIAAKATYNYCQDNMAAVIDAFFRTVGVY